MAGMCKAKARRKGRSVGKRNAQNMRTFMNVKERRKKHDENHKDDETPKPGTKRIKRGPGNQFMGFVVTKQSERRRWTTLPENKRKASVVAAADK